MGHETLDGYQNRALVVANYDVTAPVIGSPLYMALEICDEAGEIAGEIKRVYRDDDGEITGDRKARIVREMGDVLFGLAVLADNIGVSLSAVARTNIEKLEAKSECG